MTATDPDGDPLSYQWTSNCPSSIFAAPTSPSTQWGSSTAALCRIEVAATARGQTMTLGLTVNVAGLIPQTGDVDVVAEYIPDRSSPPSTSRPWLPPTAAWAGSPVLEVGMATSSSSSRTRRETTCAGS
ncbi:hypothetical protein LZ198_00205 [Myxococcus sp. K15C18031901]|uniref:hypothetical protein n=1 Tax=Myxococcus dinghuensis TaxID=2906761 RepID=UPI0020A702B7|nr:hypothetical protein [Myxococcus dinghuensis]MCP3097285.1 hypothetical protein [Myxococcus dinghuensis]